MLNTVEDVVGDELEVKAEDSVSASREVEGGSSKVAALVDASF